VIGDVDVAAMKAFLRKIHAPWIVSISSALFALTIFVLCFPQGGEARSEGIGFTMGFLGIPMTLGAIFLAWIPMSWDPNGYIPPIVTTILFLIQWQVVAWWIHKWINRPIQDHEAP
jgi:hypothetical protein